LASPFGMITECNADGSNCLVVVNNGAGGGNLAADARDPSVANNGTVAFSALYGVDGRCTPGAQGVCARHIFVMDAEGAGVRQLTSNPQDSSQFGGDSDPAVSPDGTMVAFVSNRAAASDPNGNLSRPPQIFVVNVDGSGLRQVSPIQFDPNGNPTGDIQSLAWSPDGTTLAFNGFRTERTLCGDYFGLAVPHNVIGTIALNGTGETHRACLDAPHSTSMKALDWSPDGTLIAFGRSTDIGNPAIAFIDLSGQGRFAAGLSVNQLGVSCGQSHCIGFSPESSQLAYQNGSGNISRIHLDGSQRVDTAITFGNGLAWDSGTVPAAAQVTLAPDPIEVWPTFPQQTYPAVLDAAGHPFLRTAHTFNIAWDYGADRCAQIGPYGLVMYNSTGTGRGTLDVTNAGRTSNGVIVKCWAAPPCTYTLSPSSVNVSATGGPGAVTVVADPGSNQSTCPWLAAGNAAWIAITSGSSGRGTNPVRFTVAANTGAARQGTMTVAGQTFTVNQDAAGVVPPTLHTIRGQVRDRNDTGVPGITLSVGGSAVATTTTDADGFYAFTLVAVVAGGTYTITPSRAGFVFAPASRTFTNVVADVQAAFFIASPGVFTRYFAEGATGSFFDTQIALLNATGAATQATVRFLRSDGQVITVPLALAGIARATINPETLQGLEAASFSTVIESTEPLIADRTMRWDQSGYGSHAETSIASPLTRWYLAEGATTGRFNLYYLLQNPANQAAQVEIRYLLPAPAAPVVRTYTVRANSRRTIWVNGEAPELAETDVSAVLTSTNDVPIIVERAMYLDSNGQLFGAGHASAAVPDPSTSWFFAEGATGPFFNMYILLANPNATPAEIEARYLLPSGTVVTRRYVVGGNARLTISVNNEDERLAATPLSTTLTSTNAVPILAERSMWWPAIPLVTEWQEGPTSAGATRSGEKWGLAEGEAGGPFGVQTYVLIANTSGSAGQAQVRVVFEDGSTAQLSTPLSLPANSRTTVSIGAAFPQAANRRFGVIVESLGSPAAQIVVERAMYSDAVINGRLVIWAAGTNAVGTRLR